MAWTALVIIILSFVAGVASTRDSDPAGAGYALVIPIVLGHIVALVPAIIARRSSPSADVMQRGAFRYLLFSGFGLVPTLVLGGLIPSKGPPPEPPPIAMSTIAAGFAGSINAQGAFANVSTIDIGNRSLRVRGTAATSAEYARLRARTILFARGWDRLKQVRIAVSIVGSSASPDQRCAWTATDSRTVVECLCGETPSESCADSQSPPN
jgi:hypothetical protein